MKREAKTLKIGPVGTIFGVLIPWAIGMVMIAKWVIEGLF